VLVTLSNPLNVAVLGNPGAPMARRRRASHSTRKGRRSASRLRSVWKRRTRSGSKYGHLAAVVRIGKNGAVRRGRRKHVKGHSWTGRKGSVALFSRKSGKLWGTNPRGRRFNPGALLGDAKQMILAPVTSLPKSLPALLKGKVVNHIAFAAAGGLVGLVGGSMVNRFAMPYLARIPGVSTAMANGIVQRIVGGSVALLVAGVVGKVALKSKPEARNAWVTGAAAAALVEAIFPGRLAGLLARAPLPAAVQNAVLPSASPVHGLMGLFGTNDLAAYVQSPAYQGVGAYVQSPAYQGVGAYVQSPAYQGVGGANDAVAGVGYAGEQLAGNLDGIGSNMMSHLDS
jgi:hypothetical protein